MELLQARDAGGEPSAAAVTAAVVALRRGDLVILPTDTVYGIAADSRDTDAIARLFAAKRRPSGKSIPLLAASIEQASTIADLASPLVQGLLARGWPGALTVVVRATVPMPVGVVSGNTVAVRVPDDVVVRAIAAALGRPLAVTSANRSGEAAVATFAEAVAPLSDWAAVALDGGPCPGGVASTVVDCTGSRPVVLRQGAVDVAELSSPL